MRPLLILLSATCCLAGPPVDAGVHVRLAGFEAGKNGLPAGWSVWAPRAEISPRAFLDVTRYRTGPASLALSGNSNPAVHGGWDYVVEGVQPGKWYRFTAWYRAEGVSYEPVQVLAKLRWETADGKRTGPPEFPVAVSVREGWKRLTADAPANRGAARVRIQLLLANAPQATVWWDDISFEEIPPPPPRNVTVAAVKFEPRGAGSGKEAVRRAVEVLDRTLPGKTDVIVFGESLTWAGMRGPMADAAEPIPGPSTEQLGAAARARHSYVVAGLTEREGAAIYNTAVLIDRQGRVIGKYRKTHLPYTEIEEGITPGSAYPVFETDFGKVGMMICWDTEFPDPARGLALGGAEIILVPIWAATETLMRARAMENRVFLAASNYTNPSLIMDPKGESLAVATEQGSAAVATVDLNRRYDWGGLGNMRGRIVREMHAEIPLIRPGFVH